MRSRFPAIVIGSLLGITVIADNFVKYKPLNNASTALMSWVVVISGFSMLLGAVNMTLVHGKKIRDKAPSWDESVVILVFLFVMIISGLFMGMQSAIFNFLFQNIVVAVGATIYATTVFWMASAAYRTFRIRNLAGTLVLVSAFLVILGNAPVIAMVWSKFPQLSVWIAGPPTSGAQRGLIVCAAIGAVAVGIRVLLGLERGNLGASD